jgi:hypothetical protein
MRKEYAPTPDFETNWGRRFGVIFASFFRCDINNRVATNGGLMATPLDPKQVVSFEELLMSQVV